METQNLTLAIPKEILRKVKLIAVQRESSISGLLTQMLEAMVRQEDAYVHAQHRYQLGLGQGIDLGTEGQIVSKRDALHERG